MHNLVVSCLVVGYLSANVYAIVKVRVFELARSRKHLLLYGVPFIFHCRRETIVVMTPDKRARIQQCHWVHSGVCEPLR